MNMMLASFPVYPKPFASVRAEFRTQQSSFLKFAPHSYPLASKILVKNLPYTTGETTLQKEFSNFGKIAEEHFWPGTLLCALWGLLLKIMGGIGKKRKREKQRPTIHPDNKYAETPPDFAHLASLYPSFRRYVNYSTHGGAARPFLDWTDFNATRELTRVLLLHDHSLHWQIPDGHLCPTVPNRSNYIHWLNDLLSSHIIPTNLISSQQGKVRGFDIGTGANCIYPLLGASLFGWTFVGSDVTDVAIEWATRNVNSNPHIAESIEIRKVEDNEKAPCLEGFHDGGTRIDICQEEAGLNPKTSCGGTSKEMVCPGGEKAFVARIIEDSVVLKHQFRWFTSMVGRKSSLKSLVSKLWEVGVTIVKTTEFVQGRTSRWGLAWSFLPPIQKPSISLPQKNMSFMLEGLPRQHGAINVLEAVKSYFSMHGLSCTLNTSAFTVDVVASKDECDSVLKNHSPVINKSISFQPTGETSNGPRSSDRWSLRILVFQQIPGTLLVKGSLQDRSSPLSGMFAAIFQKLEEALRHEFCTKSA
ncbi:hypothetical protein Ahy_B01g052460 isoform A [Arachis hypogaea]|uniref:U6 small nuclear RNA (adenine-(43)-N(6))-methyltransferase n=1 Tax=Arachis hypogaea TaxID=3818 RepID=A0A445APN4_ARAHY|nr:hypothetical protein Ahy_B01g052460 isoform A [Arachis hypogaea]